MNELICETAMNMLVVALVLPPYRVAGLAFDTLSELEEFIVAL